MARKGSPKRETAARILAAADELLGEVGFEGASVGEVAQRAGVNKALIFYYFNSKAELFERVLERYYANHLQALSGAFDAAGPLVVRLHRMIDVYFDFIIDNRRYPRLIQQLVSGSDAHLALVQRNLTPLFEWITKALSEVTPATGPLSARHFWVTFSGTVINYFTYAPVLAPVWGEDPMSPNALSERRTHLHWMVDAVLSRLSSDDNTDLGQLD